MELIKLNKARQALIEAESLDEIQEIMDRAVAFRAYAKAAKMGIEMQNNCAEIKIRAERKAGEFLAENVNYGGDRKTKSRLHSVTLKSYGIEKIQSHRWQKIASVPDDEFEKHISKVKNKKDELTSVSVLNLVTKPHVTNNSGQNEWYTPPEIISAVRIVLGEIDLDPASSDIANRIVKAKRYYTKENDGLSKEWSGRIFLNPPYSQPLIKYFSNKFCMSKIDTACVLVNNATDTAWFQAMASKSAAICFMEKRVRFLDMNGNAIGAPLQGQSVLYYGNDIQLFAKVFGKFGFVLRHV